MPVVLTFQAIAEGEGYASSFSGCDVEWDLKGGKGSLKLGSGAYDGQYSSSSRFDKGMRLIRE